MLTNAVSTIRAMDQDEKNIKLDEKIWVQLPRDKNNGESGILLEKIVYHHFVDSFCQKDTPRQIHDHIVNMSSVNKELCNFVQNPRRICFIIDKLSNRQDQCRFADRIQTNATRNYSKQTKILHKYGHRINSKRIHELFQKGADLNFDPSYNYPTLCVWEGGVGGQKKIYANTELLLQLDADPNVGSESGRYPLRMAIQARKMPIIKLLLSYNPRKKHLSDAIEYLKIPELAEMVKHGTFTREELNEALKKAKKRGSKKMMSIFIAAGAQPEICSFVHELRTQAQLPDHIDAISHIIFNNFKDSIVTTVVNSDGCIIPIVNELLLFLCIGNPQITQELLALGVNPLITDCQNNALEANLKRKNYECIVPFLKYVPGDQYIRSALETKNAAIINLFLNTFEFTQRQLIEELNHATILCNVVATQILLNFVSDKKVKSECLSRVLAIAVGHSLGLFGLNDDVCYPIAVENIKIVCEHLQFPLDAAMKLLEEKIAELAANRDKEKTINASS